MKTSTRFIFRKMKKQRGQMLGMGLLIFVAALFFTTIYSFKNTYQVFTEDYFQQQHYADITLTGSFTKEEVAKLEKEQGITKVEARSLMEVKDQEITYRFISLTSKMNQLSITKGRLPKNTKECAVISQFARKHQITVGDPLTISNQERKVVGIVSSPEYVYYVQNARTMFADLDKFAVVFVDQLPGPYNQILLETSDALSEKRLASKIKFNQYTKVDDQINYQMYEGDLGQFESFAFIFPTIFWLISFCIIFILLRRTILKEHKQLGIMKALGHSNTTIMKIYLMQFGLLGIIASSLGCLASIPLSNWLLSMIRIMIELPTLALRMYPKVWSVAVGVSVLGCLLAGSLAMLSVLKELPAVSMKPRMPRATKRSLFEKLTFIWSKWSFNTRYAMKSSVRNKGRFFVMVLGIAASTALMCFSLGFNDSLHQITHQYFDEFASYDLVVEGEPLPLGNNPFAGYSKIDQHSPALQMPTKVRGEEYLLTVLESDTTMLNLNQQELKEGIVIPEYYAEKWGVRVGDTVKIDDHRVSISGIIRLGMGLSMFTSYHYAKDVLPDVPQVYNTTYMKSERLDSLETALLEDEYVFSTVKDDISSFNSLLENLQILIWLLIACGVILGITVVLCINLMNLTVREFEYMFMNIMGYSKRKILSAIFKESIVQLCLAIPTGFFCGYLLLQMIKGEFSQNSFALYPAIRPISFILSGTVILIMSSLRIIAANRFINKLDIVEGLKIQED
ncbi:ABC transporter permease [Enterococcus florum]|uniref:ABC transporter permease n=1 Tax=Enterococcus florum TaxID=2480627 RepID=A0A4P5PIX7_9ENTE|nr:ABC transporter permease [Enterococcus florum]GCF95542.1 ABC transporter permease [Enterococcus florum]